MVDIRASSTMELAFLLQAIATLQANPAAEPNPRVPSALRLRMQLRVLQLVKFLELDRDWSAWSEFSGASPPATEQQGPAQFSELIKRYKGKYGDAYYPSIDTLMLMELLGRGVP